MFYGEFSSARSVCEAFAIDRIDGHILFAVYEHESYTGQATVILVNQGKLWLVEGNHCSCYGLEDQFKPEEISFSALLHIAENGNGLLSQFKDKVVEALWVYETYNLAKAEPAQIDMLIKLAYTDQPQT